MLSPCSLLLAPCGGPPGLRHGEPVCYGYPHPLRYTYAYRYPFAPMTNTILSHTTRDLTHRYLQAVEDMQVTRSHRVSMEDAMDFNLGQLN